MLVGGSSLTDSGDVEGPGELEWEAFAGVANPAVVQALVHQPHLVHKQFVPLHLAMVVPERVLGAVLRVRKHVAVKSQGLESLL